VAVVTEFPIAWEVRTAKDGESLRVPDLLDETRRRGFAADIANLDKGYDNIPVYEACSMADQSVGSGVMEVLTPWV